MSDVTVSRRRAVGRNSRGWMFTWVVDIRELYHLNATRLAQWEAGWSLEHQSSAFAECHHALKAKLREMQERCETHLQEPALHLAKQKVLSSLHNHWDGLTVCVDRPEVAMDNNTAERILRNPVVGRKNKYPPAKPEVLRWLAPQRGLIAIAKSKPKTEKTGHCRLPELSNFGSPPAEPGVYPD